jgi:hypothetical protein
MGNSFSKSFNAANMGKSVQIKIPDLMIAIHRPKSTVHANERAICRE